MQKTSTSIGSRNLYALGKVITLFALFAFTDPASAQESRQKRISVNFQSLSLREALDQVQTMSGTNLVYSRDIFNLDQKITITVVEQPLEIVLTRMLGKGYQFKKVDNNIVISKSISQAASGRIDGVVADSQNELLIGANVWIKELSKGTTVDVEGNFRMDRIPPGSYTLVVSFIGYNTQTIADVKVAPGETTTLNIKLPASSKQLSEVIVRGGVDVKTAEVRNTDEVSLINEIRRSDLIVTGISSIQISRSLDFNAAEVVQRAPGISVINNFINVRGLYERYNMVYINNMIAPSSESDRRAFSFDLIPSGVIDKIIIHRNPAPELPGDFAGGLVKIHTKDAVPARQLQIRFATQYRNGSSLRDTYTYNGSKTDWLGFDNGVRKLPAEFPSRSELPIVPSPAPSNLPPQTIADNVGYARKLNNDWNLISNDPSGLDYRGELDYYNSWQIGTSRLNTLSTVFYTHEYQTISQDFQIGPDGDEDVKYRDSIFYRTARLGVMQNFNLKVNDRHKFHFDNFFNQLGRDETLLRGGREFESFSPQDSVLQVQYFWQERSLYTGQIGGKHLIGKKDHSISWGGGYSHTFDNVPNERRYEIRYKPTYAKGVNTLIATDENGGEGFEFNLQNYHTTTEGAFSYFADTEWMLPFQIKLKTGGFTEFKKRSFDNRFITIRPGPDFTQDDNTLNLVGVNRQYMLSELFGNNFRLNGTGWIIRDEGLEASSYNATQDYYAGYVATSIPLFADRLKLYGGIRYEWNRLMLKNEQVPGSSVPDVDQLTRFWLPSLNVSWALNDRMLLRSAYGKSLNRPQFRELSVFRNFDLEEGYLVGNASLVTAEIHNIDFRWEYYPSEGQWISAGVFYKNFNNPIEYIANTQSGALRASTVMRNVSGATAYGTEVEIRKRLDFIPGLLFKKWSVIINGAYIWNRADLGATDIDYGNDLRDAARPLQGTSPFLINTSVYYENEKTGTVLSVQHNIFGQRLLLAANIEYSDIFERPRHSLDFNIKQRLFKDFEIQAGVKNILNQPFRQYRDFYRDGKYDPDKVAEGTSLEGGGNVKAGSDYYFRYFKEGAYFSFGIHYILR